jgi:DNA-binding NarL/FixJ family response regulator
MLPSPNVAENLKLLIADDHALFRGGLKHLVQMISTEIEVVEANGIDGVLENIAADPDLDLVLLDLMMPGVDGMDGLDKLRSKWPEIPVIVVSALEDGDTIRDALSRGAMGFIPKSSAANVTSSAIQLVLAGGIYVPPTLLSQLDGAATNNGPQPALTKEYAEFGLTERQVDVMKLVSLGKSNNHIAEQLGLTAGTVKMHVSRIFKVLDVGNRTEAAALFGEIEKKVAP